MARVKWCETDRIGDLPLDPPSLGPDDLAWWRLGIGLAFECTEEELERLARQDVWDKMHDAVYEVFEQYIRERESKEFSFSVDAY